MAALNQVALIAGGCSQSCTFPVVGRSTGIAYCSPTAIYLHTPTQHHVLQSNNNSNNNNTNTKDTNSTEGKVTYTYPLTRIFANGITGTIQSFDFNEEYMACVTNGGKSTVWRLNDSELLNNKRVPSGVWEFFKREGNPCVVRVAGKHHIIFGNNTGWLVSANLNDGVTTHQVKLSIDERNINRNNSVISNSNINTNNVITSLTSVKNVGYVSCIDVSPSRPDTIAAGTSEGILCIISLHPTNGMRQTTSLKPFPSTLTNSPPENVGNNSTNNIVTAAPVTVVAFDPNNANYIAVASREGVLALVDISTSTVVQTFEVNDNPIKSISWLVGQAGTFITTDGLSGKLKVWTVSNRTSAQVISPVIGETLISGISFAPEQLFLALNNGSVVVYNTRNNQIEMKNEAGHTDIIHSCRYAQHDRDLLASASTDGTIRVWNTKQLTLQHQMYLGQIIIYSVDWSPTGKYHAAGLSNGEVVCYHVSTHRENWRVSVTAGGEPVLNISWSHSESGNQIAASYRSGITILAARDGKIIRRYKTKSSVLSVDFDPKHSKQIVAGCQDGQVLIFQLTSTQETPAVILTGHNDSISSVLFNPTAINYVLTSSYDTTLRLWDISSMNSHTISVNSRVLRGHTDKVSCIAWCSIAPYLAISGSYDCTVRLWDMRNGMNITTVRSHNAEVSALSGHPERPLVFASVSRDSSIIFWHLGLLRNVHLDAALGTLDKCIISDSNTLMAVSNIVSVSVVSGEEVVQLSRELKETNMTPHKRIEKIVGFFEFPFGAADVARIAGYCVDPQDISNAKCTVIPNKKLIEVRGKWSKAMVEKAHGKTVAGAGEEYKKTRLIEAAESMLQLGKIGEYCQLMIEAGEWDSAISAAPVISREYWRSLCLQAGEAMEVIGDTRALRYFIMAEESIRAARFIARQSNKNLDVALVIAQTCPQRLLEQGNSTEPSHNTMIDTNGNSNIVKELLDTRATVFTYGGNPRILAAAKLADGENDAAVMHLIYTGDVVMAHLLIHTVPLQKQTTIDAGYRLSMLQSCRQRQWETALLCATRQSNPYDGLATVLAFFQQAQGKVWAAGGNNNNNNSGNSSSTTNTNTNTTGGVIVGNNNTPPTVINEKLKSFHEQILSECKRLQLPLDMESIQRKHANDGLASVNQLAAMAISPNTPIGVVTSEELLQTMSNFMESLLQAALQDIDSPNAVFYLKQAFTVTCYVSLPIQLPPKSPGNNNHNSTLPGASISFIGGATHSNIVRKFLAQSFLIAALMCVKVYRLPRLLNPAFTKARELSEGDSASMTLLNKIQPTLGAYSPHSIEVDCTPLGASLPTFSIEEGQQLKSIVTAETVGGAVHILEDGVSIMGKSEALQWMLCCAFSPIASGARLLPL